MLPDRSKRYAGIDGDIPRLGLASHWQLFLIALLVIALLVIIFPRKALVEQLYAHETLDELTQSYIQNLYRANPRNADIAILLARTQQERMDLATLESMLSDLARKGDLRQRSVAQAILVRAYTVALTGDLSALQRQVLQTRIEALMDVARADPLSESVARSFANLALQVGLQQQGLDFLGKVALGRSASALERYARGALATGEYSIAAEYYFMAREVATEPTEMRRLFFAGMDTLMAGSLFNEAMLAAQKRLGSLYNDPQSLRRMASIALAAGAPTQAAVYARALVFETAAQPSPP